jgi:sporadic carbohydrate cluster protein (TIGR04323 family)
MTRNSTWSAGEPRVSAPPYLGYNFSSAVGGQLVPQRVQNLTIRDYAATKGLNVSFSVSEYADERETLMLFAQLPKLDRISGFVFYSLRMLPADARKRMEFLEQVTRAGKEVHFALEDLAVRKPEECRDLDRMYRISADRRLEDARQSLLAFARGDADRR